MRPIAGRLGLRPRLCLLAAAALASFPIISLHAQDGPRPQNPVPIESALWESFVTSRYESSLEKLRQRGAAASADLQAALQAGAVLDAARNGNLAGPITGALASQTARRLTVADAFAALPVAPEL